MERELERRIALVASDRESGASEILDDAIAILQTALAAKDVTHTARALCRAQPSMASVWNAALAAIAAVDDPAVFERFAHRVVKAPEALARYALECFQTAPPRPGEPPDASPPLRIVTMSFSRSVITVLEALARARSLRVACSEGRPALEGRRLAARLAARGIPVALFSDAAIGCAVGAADAVVVGADAIAPEWFLNKCGTRMLAAAAAQQNTPVYVVAGRDKFVSHAMAPSLRIREGKAAEVWEGSPSGVTVRNPYFEPTPLDLVTSVISDTGVLDAAVMPEVCESVTADLPSAVLENLGLIK